MKKHAVTLNGGGNSGEDTKIKRAGSIPARILSRPYGRKSPSSLNGAIQIVLKLLFVLPLLFKKEDNSHSSSGYSCKSRNNCNKNSKVISFFQCEHLHL